MALPRLKSYPTPRRGSIGTVSRPKALAKPRLSPDVRRVHGRQRATGTNLNG